ncbi:MAG: ABC transporter permease [Actinomyces sp.]|nr:ABC transporter permease [Actinomyces sp.]MCI1642576.1 ABC transporter permease [Actinomyces sp.]MCI1788585.1 ABC transporter permease [Actinomyces sp.]MCI1830240.1 ABC transporter permease [Actinomyces sp.]MCI1866803.1 ABC transporter permease [Actinomyces sp.]
MSAASPATRAPAPPMRGAGRLAWYSFAKLVTNPFSLAFAIGLPILMYLMFGANQDYSGIWAGHANVSATVLVNMALYGAVMTTSSAGANVSLERTSGVTRLFALTPLSPAAQIAARVLAGIGAAGVVIGVTYVFGALTGSRMEGSAWAVSALLLVVLAVLPTVLGLAAGFAVRSDGAFAATSIVTVLCSFLSGMFIPLEQMGSFFQSTAPWTPFHGIVQLVQLPLTGWDGFRWSWVANYAVWTLLFAGVAVWGQRRDTGR